MIGVAVAGLRDFDALVLEVKHLRRHADCGAHCPEGGVSASHCESPCEGNAEPVAEPTHGLD
jgi:hypothetical protein